MSTQSPGCLARTPGQECWPMAGQSRAVGSMSCGVTRTWNYIPGELKRSPGPWERGETLGWAGPLEPGRALKALEIPKYHSAIFIYERLVKSNMPSIDSIHVGTAKERILFWQITG